MNLHDVLGDFEFILFILTVATGIIWLLDKFYFSRQRRAKADAALKEFDARNAIANADVLNRNQHTRADLERNILREPVWFKYTGSFFPVIFYMNELE
ncbi:MAG TPA: hypothetical protein VIF82_08105 [Burkholderiaceae bacterium]|jgi:signal peptidase I